MYTESLRNIRKGKVRKWLKVSQGGFVFSQNTRSVYPYVWQLSKPSSFLLHGSSAVYEMVMSLGSNAGCGCIVVCLDVKFSLVVSSQSMVSLCREMSLSRPFHEDLKDLNREAVGELGRPRLENKTCAGAVDNLPQGLSPAGESWGVLGPGSWRFVACIADSPLPQRGACHGWDRCDVWSLSTSLSVTPLLSMPYLVGKSKIITSLSGPPHEEDAAWWDAGGSCHGWRDAALGQSGTAGMRVDRRGGSGSITKLLFVLQCSCKNEKCIIWHPGLFTKVCSVSAHWPSATAWLSSKFTLEHPSWSPLAQVLTCLLADAMDGRSLPAWLHSSYRLCSIRVQISFALFSFRKKKRKGLFCLSLKVPET